MISYFPGQSAAIHKSTTTHEEKKSMNKVRIFVFFVHKKYSRSFIKLQLNHWCHMDNFNDVFTMFLCPDRVSSHAVYGRVRELSDFIKIS